MTEIDFEVYLSQNDHVFQYVYQPLNLGAETNGLPRYGMTVRASAWPLELRERSRVVHFEDRGGPSPKPYPVLGRASTILLAGGHKPRVDWVSAAARQQLSDRLDEARLRNESPDWAFRGLQLVVKGRAMEIGEIPKYKEGRVPLPRDFAPSTLIYITHEVIVQ